MGGVELEAIPLLALECGSWRASVALAQGDEIVEGATEDDSAKNSDVLMPMAHRLLAERGLQWQELKAIAYGAGPGAFTGLRVACGLAQGLSFGIGCPLIPVGSLECLAEGLTEHRPIVPGMTVLTALDARMGELYLATVVRTDHDWNYVVPPCLLTPDGVHQYASTVDFMVGDGLLIMAAVPERSKWVEEAPQQPTARAMARLAQRRFAAGLGQDPLSAELFYIRDKVALTSKERGR